MIRWRQALASWTAMGLGERADAAGGELAARLFEALGDMIGRVDPADADGVIAAWRQVRDLYADPVFGELGARHPGLFVDFVRRSARTPRLEDAEPHGADLSPCVVDALVRFGVEPHRSALRTLCRKEMARAFGGLQAASEAARRLLEDPAFQRPVLIGGDELVARRLAAEGVRLRSDLPGLRWSYVVQLNALIAQGGEDGDIIQPRRLAFRLALAGLQPGQAWGLRDAGGPLTAEAWRQAFPGALVRG